jgi:hypothetical protein
LTSAVLLIECIDLETTSEIEFDLKKWRFIIVQEALRVLGTDGMSEMDSPLHNLLTILNRRMNANTSVSIVIGCWLDDRRSIPCRGGEFLFFMSVAYQASYPLGTGGEAAGM